MKRLLTFLLFVLPTLVLSASFDSYESPLIKTIPLRSCIGSDVKIINDNADWGDINSDAALYNTFCVEPGNYSGVGTITITASGTAATPKVIQYYSDTDSGLSPFYQVDVDRARIPKITFNGADHWILTRLYSHSPTANTDNQILAKNECSNLTFDQMFFNVNMNRQVQISSGCDDVTLQNSVLRNARSPNPNAVGNSCVSIKNWNGQTNVDRVHVLGNEIYDCFSDGIHINHDDRPNQTNGVQFVVEDNHIYITPYLYTDGETPGSYDPTGKYACSENAIDVKITGESGQDISRITRNVMWGFRKTQPSDSGLCDQNGSRGSILTIHNETGWGGRSAGLEISDNVGFDSHNGWNLNDGESQHVSYWRNLAFEVGGDGDETPSGAKYQFIGNGRGNNEDYWNIYVDGQAISQLGNSASNKGIWKDFMSTNTDTRNNIIVDTQTHEGAAKAGSKVGYNAFYDTTAYTGANYEAGTNVTDTVANADMDQFCFTRKLLTDPEQICVDNVITTVTSPHYGNLDPEVGKETNRGVSNLYPVSGDWVFDNVEEPTPFLNVVTQHVVPVYNILNAYIPEGYVLECWIIDQTSPGSASGGGIPCTTTVQRDGGLSQIASTGLTVSDGDPITVYLRSDPDVAGQENDGYLGVYQSTVSY